MEFKITNKRKVWKSVLPAALSLAAGLAAAVDTRKAKRVALTLWNYGHQRDPLLDAVLKIIDEQNKKGGPLGENLETVVIDLVSNWPLFAARAAELLEKNTPHTLSSALSLNIRTVPPRMQFR